MNPTEQRSLVSTSLPLWILFLGHIFASLFLRNLGTGLDAIEDPHLRPLSQLLYAVYLKASHWAVPLMLVFVTTLQIRIFLGKPVQLGIDFIGALLSLRCLFLFLILNLLLLSKLKAGGMLLMQLILFIPVITLNFGWLYWRLDAAARLKGGSHIRFSESAGTLDPFDYFHIAAMTLLQFEPSGATATSRLMKALFVIHGAMMLDLVALALSRAISLASGG
jgi:hypothetical protein